MADAIDVLLLSQDTKELSHCDFSGETFEDKTLKERNFDSSLLRSKWIRCDFSESTFKSARLGPTAIFDRCIFRGSDFSLASSTGVEFTDCDFHDAIMKTNFSNAVFQGCDLRGADFQRARLSGTRFIDCISDDSTNFNGAFCARADSRLLIYQDYAFEDGTLKRAKDFSVDPAQPHQVDEGDPDAFELRRRRPFAIASALESLVNEEIERLENLRPNDLETQSQVARYIAFLGQVSKSAAEIRISISADNIEPEIQSKVQNLQHLVENWIKENGTLAFDVSARSTIAALSIGLLSLAGAALWPASIAVLCAVFGPGFAKFLSKDPAG